MPTAPPPPPATAAAGSSLTVVALRATNLQLPGILPASQRNTYIRLRCCSTAPRRAVSKWKQTSPALADAWPNQPLRLPAALLPGGAELEIQLWVVGIRENTKVGVAVLPVTTGERKTVVELRSPDSRKVRGKLELHVRGTSPTPRNPTPAAVAAAAPEPAPRGVEADAEVLEYPRAGVHQTNSGKLADETIPPYDIPYDEDSIVVEPSAPPLEAEIHSPAEPHPTSDRYPTMPTLLMRLGFSTDQV